MTSPDSNHALATASAPRGGQGAAASSGAGFAWNPAILGDREPVLGGYGIRPGAAKDRARLVRAAVRTDGKRLRRPLLLLVLGGLVGIAGWLAVSWFTAKAVWETSTWPGPYALETGLGIAAYLAGVIVFSWGWELGIAARAVRLALLLVVLGVVIWLVVAIVAFLLVALLTDGDGGGGGGGGSGGGPRGSGGGEGFLAGIGRSVGNAVEDFTSGGDDLQADDAAAVPAPCARCGTLVDPATMRMCPSCGLPV